jgi:hypothetical protein
MEHLHPFKCQLLQISFNFNKTHKTMALQKNIKLTDNFGIEVEIPNAYIKISKVECTKNQMNFFIDIKQNSSEIPFLNKVEKLDYDINGVNPIKQAYLYLKTLPEFAGAVDC